MSTPAGRVSWQEYMLLTNARKVTESISRFGCWGYGAWLVLIAVFAVLHTLNLRADFPNHTAWALDWAKYTDEGWYGNAASRAHLFGNWYMDGDFNPAVAVPVWPFAEWVLFFFTGVSIQAARGLAVACFLANLALSYLLLRARGSRWMALLGVTMLATSPFLYCFTRLAILEPMQTTLVLAALNVAVRLDRLRQPVAASAGIGLLLALAMLTKTTAAFLAPAMLWAIVVSLWEKRKTMLLCAAATAGTWAAVYAAWLGLVVSRGLYGDYKYYFFINTYEKPSRNYWPLISLWWSVHGLYWIDHSLLWLATAVAAGAVIACLSRWGRRLWREPLFGCSLLAVAGYVLFMTMQNHPQPRYYAVPAFFIAFVIALGVEALVKAGSRWKLPGGVALAAVVAAACLHGTRTIGFAAHPEFTLAHAAEGLTHYIDEHPNGNRLLVSISGDEITLMTGLPTLCDDFGMEGLATKSVHYQPGWYAAWNDLDPGTLADLHEHYSLEQVAAFDAMDHPDRNRLVLFKLNPLPDGEVRNQGDEDLMRLLPDDNVDVDVE